MAMTLKDLESQLSGLQAYTPETEDALRQRAENIYNPQYEQDLQSIRDSLQLGINQQNRNMIGAGMQRSSYGQSAIAALRGKGLQAEAQLGAQRDANIATLLNQLIEGEKDRKLNADQYRDNLLLQLYQLANKGSGKGNPDPKDPDKDLLSLWDDATKDALLAKKFKKGTALLPVDDHYLYNARTGVDKVETPISGTNSTYGNTSAKQLKDPFYYTARDVGEWSRKK